MEWRAGPPGPNSRPADRQTDSPTHSGINTSECQQWCRQRAPGLALPRSPPGSYAVRGAPRPGPPGCRAGLTKVAAGGRPSVSREPLRARRIPSLAALGPVGPSPSLSARPAPWSFFSLSVNPSPSSIPPEAVRPCRPCRAATGECKKRSKQSRRSAWPGRAASSGSSLGAAGGRPVDPAARPQPPAARLSPVLVACEDPSPPRRCV